MTSRPLDARADEFDDPLAQGRSRPHSIRLGRILRLALVGSLVIVVFTQPIPLLMIPGVRRALLAVAVVIGTLGWISEARRPRLPSILVAFLGATVVVTALSAWASDWPSAAFFNLWMAAAFTGISVLVWRWLQDEEARTEAIIVVGFGGFLLVCLTYLGAVGAVAVDWSALGMDLADLPLRPANVGGLVPGPIWTSDYALLLAPVALLAPALIMTRARGWVQIAIVAITAATVLFGASRGLWLATGLVLAVIALAWAWRRRSVFSADRGRLVASIVALTGGIVAITIVTLPRLGGLLRDIDEGRTGAFQTAIDIFRRFPLLGAGPGSYAPLRVGYPTDVLNELTLPDPHNGLLATMSDTGLLGTLALAGTMAVLGILIVRALRPSHQAIAAAACAGLAIILLHRMMDMVFFIPGLMVAGIIVVGIAMGPGSETRPAGWRRFASIGVVAVGLVLTATTLPGLIKVEGGLDAYRTAAAAWSRGDVATADEQGRRAIDAAPDLVPAYQLMAMVAERDARPDEAVEFAAEAARLEPMGQNQVRLAAALIGAGRSSEAEGLLHDAAARPPQDPIVLLNAATLGGISDRQSLMVQTLMMDQEIAAFPGSFTGVSGIDLSGAIDAAHAQLLSSNQSDAALRLALFGERADLAAAATDTMVGAQRDAATLLTQGWFGLRDTATELDAMAQADPSLATSAYLLALRTCDETGSKRWAQVIDVETGDAPESVVRVGPGGLSTGDFPPRYPNWVWGEVGRVPTYPSSMWAIDRRPGVTCFGERTDVPAG